MEMNFNIKELKWTREPESFSIEEDKIVIITKPHTDLWQRTYYHFRNDNAPVLQITTDAHLPYVEGKRYHSVWHLCV